MLGGSGRWVVRVAFLVALGRGNAPAEEPTPSGADGTIKGVVLDKTSGDPVIEAGVEVVGTGVKAKTDLDGRYAVKVPPGEYEVRIFAPLYQATRLQKIAVRANEVTKADATLASAGQANVEVVEVIAQAKKATEATQLLKRQKAATVSDNVSAEAIAKSPDASAGEVVKRVPAVTVKNDNRYVYVRGLGERYSSAILDGSRLPSPDPDKRVVPLDLFPSAFIDSLSIIKSYQPDLPGDFAGGLVDINLREFPETFQLGTATALGVNSSTSFRKFRTYSGTAANFFGYPRPFFDYPSGPPDGVADIPNGTLPVSEPRRFAEQLPYVWSPHSTTGAGTTGLNANVGNSYGPFGFELAGIYNTEFLTVGPASERQFTSTDSGPVLLENFVTNTSWFKTTLGGILTAAYQA